VLCIECDAAIGAKGVAGHIYDNHADAKIRLDHTKLRQVLSDLQVKDSFDLKDLPQDCPQIEGLHITPEAYLCSYCGHIRGNLGSIKEHHFSAHEDLPTPTSWERVAAQQLHHKQTTPYFKVRPTTTAPKANAATQFFLLHQKQREKVVANFDLSKIDPRQVCGGSVPQNGTSMLHLMNTAILFHLSNILPKQKLSLPFWPKLWNSTLRKQTRQSIPSVP